MTAPTNFARLVVPETAGGSPANSSYLRLGRYESVYESSLTTELSATTDQSSAQTSDNTGILLYTNHDLNETVGGMVLQKYGTGHTTQVTTADATYNVLDGEYLMTASDGVSITAGNSSKASDMHLTAYGHIKQTAYGPLDEWTYGTTTKKTMGAANEWIFGAKDSMYLGTVNNFTVGLTTSLFVGLSFSLKIAGDLSMFLGGRISIELSGRVIISLGAACTIVWGVSFNKVFGADTKIVTGLSSKIALSDSKILATTDFKIAPVGDSKKVGINMTICDIDLKKEIMTAKNSSVVYYKELFATATKNLEIQNNGTCAHMYDILTLM